MVSETGKLTRNSSQSLLGKHFKDTAETCSSTSSSISDNYIESSDIFDEITTIVSLEEIQWPLVTSSPRSILKSRTKSERRYIRSNKRNWMCLPPPDMDRIRELHSCIASTSTCSSGSGNGNRVGFDSVTIRSYQQTIGDNPSVSHGPPIQLDWEYEEHDGMDIDVYESLRFFSRRTVRQLAISHYQRTSVLSREYGFTEEELTQAKKDANKTKLRRAITNILLPMMRVEDALESAGRKAKRVIRKGKE